MYFYQFLREVQNQVKVSIIDRYIPFPSLIKECFKNAKISIDCFHIVQNFA
ncbi:transposase [Lactovum miscens]|uniref:transposase n=1 Tax=Lactovum miscens TaxID=190387 RepID=UPI0039C9C353